MLTNEIKSMSLTELADILQETLFDVATIAALTSAVLSTTPDAKLSSYADRACSIIERNSLDLGEYLDEIRARDAQGGEAVTEGYER